MVNVHVDKEICDIQLTGEPVKVYSEITAAILHLCGWVKESNTPKKMKAGFFTIIAGYCLNPEGDLDKYVEGVTDAMGEGGEVE